MVHVSLTELQAGLPAICDSPSDGGRIHLIVRRPAVDEREAVAEATLDRLSGLVGDTWNIRRSIRTPDRLPNPDMQVTVINVRLAALIAGPEGGGTGAGGDSAGDPSADEAVGAGFAQAGLKLGEQARDLMPGPGLIDRLALAGDQLVVDLDLSEANLPPGSRLQLGTALIEVTAAPHLGCAKFSHRFGIDAMRFVNSTVGRSLRLRGLNARVIHGGTIGVGDRVSKVGVAAQRSS